VKSPRISARSSDELRWTSRLDEDARPKGQRAPSETSAMPRPGERWQVLRDKLPDRLATSAAISCGSEVHPERFLHVTRPLGRAHPSMAPAETRMPDANRCRP